MPVLTFNLVNGPAHSSPHDPSLLLANDCAISKLIALTNRRRSSQQKKTTRTRQADARLITRHSKATSTSRKADQLAVNNQA
jgi:hypothetical protein